MTEKDKKKLGSSEVRERVCALREANGGRITPKMLVEDAMDESSPLHDLFSWDLSVAAWRYWIIRAQEIIRVVHIEFIVKGVTVRVPENIHVEENGDGGNDGYRSVDSLRHDVERRRAAMEKEMEMVEGMIRRVLDLAMVLDEFPRVQRRLAAACSGTLQMRRNAKAVVLGAGNEQYGDGRARG